MGLDQPGFLVVVGAPVFITQSPLFFPFFPVENLVAENRRICVCAVAVELVSTAENGITDIEMMGNAKRKEVGLVREEGYYFRGGWWWWWRALRYGILLYIRYYK